MAVRPIPITGYSLCNGLGRNRRAVRDALFDGKHGLGPSPIALPFATVVGAVDFALPVLPVELQPWSTRTARIAKALLDELASELERLRRRWRPERIAVVSGRMGSTMALSRSRGAPERCRL